MVSRCANLALAAVVFAGISGSVAGAASLSQTYTGTLANQATPFLQNFTLSSASDVTIYTTSYGGGTNLDGTTTSAGGFQPSLVLFDSAGNYVANEVTAGTSPIANPDASNGWALDAYLSDSNAPAGSYTVALTDWLTQQSPMATNLSDGFTFDLGSGGSSFVDAQGNSRTSAYALNISATPVSGGGGGMSAVPEPATFFLILPAFALALLLRKRIQSARREN
ncbi:MAG: DVUA0089 family protein [Bryobacteraceae bacterium]